MNMSRFIRGAAWVLWAFIIAYALSHPSQAAESEVHHFNVEFSKETTAEEAVWQSLNIIDVAQTLYIANHPDRFYETNAAAFIGAHPSRGGVIGYMVGCGILHYAIAIGIENLVQRDNRYRVLQRVFQAASIGEKSYNVIHNQMVGIKP